MISIYQHRMSKYKNNNMIDKENNFHKIYTLQIKIHLKLEIKLFFF